MLATFNVGSFIEDHLNFLGKKLHSCLTEFKGWREFKPKKSYSKEESWRIEGSLTILCANEVCIFPLEKILDVLMR